MLLVEVERLKRELNKQAEIIVSGLKQELNDRSVGGMAFEAKELLSEIKDLLKNSQNSTLSSQGSIEDGNDYLVAEVETETTTVSTKTTRRKLQLYTHTGRPVLLPKDNIFPKLTLATLITAWHCGN